MAEQKISLRAARVNANMTQEQVSKELKVSKKTVQNWEKGATVPDIEQALSLQALFRYPLTHIFFGSDSAKSEIENKEVNSK